MNRKEPQSVEEIQAQKAEKLLERNRIGLESAIDAQEAVGYKISQRDDDTYGMKPPYTRLT